MEVMCACQLTAWLIRDISNLKLVSGCLYASQRSCAAVVKSDAAATK
jgi:hypothetical protein